MDQMKILDWAYLLIRLGYYTVAAYGLFLLVVWWQDTTPPIVFKEAAISATRVQPGERVVVTQHLYKQRQCLGDVNRYLEGACGYKSLSENNAVLSLGAHQIIVPITIPADFLSGCCQFMSRYQYVCNPLDYLFNRKIYYSPPIEFEVVK